MSEKKRYLVGNIDSAVVPHDMETMLDSYVTEQKVIKCLRKIKTGQRVLEMTEEQAAKLVETRSDLIIEEDLELEMFFGMPGLEPSVPLETELLLNVSVTDEQTKKGISDVTVYCVGDGVAYKGITDKMGVAGIKINETHLKRIIASPRDKYWSKVVPSPMIGEETQVSIKLQEIPVNGSYNWGYSYLGVDKINKKFTGKGVKVAVIDSGISTHEDLKVTGGHNTLDGQDPEAWNVDEKGHGTHTSGIIAAQQNEIGIIGVAPDAEVYSLKVFPGGRFSDLIEAINWCIDNYMDVISMSLGSSIPSLQIQKALSEATERGLTCIAAAGNNGGAVSYPAAYENVVAVSAIGKLDTFPEDSAHVLKVGHSSNLYPEIFFADFSNFGTQIDVCAPGVAILSSVPTGYASWDGTSMACPIVSGLAALILEAYPEIRTGDEWQQYYVREIIINSAEDIGMSTEMQGAGLPNAELALFDAYAQREHEDKMLNSYRKYMEEMLERAKKQAEKIKESIKKLDDMK